VEFLNPEHPLTYNTTCKSNNANTTLVNLQNVQLADIFWLRTRHCWQTRPTDADFTIAWNGLMQDLCVTFCVIVNWLVIIKLLCEIVWGMRGGVVGRWPCISAWTIC